ncbi:hypothetical protein C8F04DRAFT_1251668 [Mycena alexandri]|uniref:Uncharacterized protein n=1 Tax=Mycena alexandri TaxID=1745969 RepID=A0AAD6TD11_9AGAR|nr:hypothetical protein C8F04DRAFT_1251668 [Mycena alexandri]
MSPAGARQPDCTAPPKNSILSFFLPVDREGEPGVRRRLNMPVPIPRKRPMTAGRTNPLKSQPGAEGSDLLRRSWPLPGLDSHGKNLLLSKICGGRELGLRTSKGTAMIAADYVFKSGRIPSFTHVATVIVIPAPEFGLKTSGPVLNARPSLPKPLSGYKLWRI